MSERLPTLAEQWAAYDEAVKVWRREYDSYQRGERLTPPPRPVRPHTPGPSYGTS